MKTSQEWWTEVKKDPALLTDWLVKQYRGEITAANRITRFAHQYSNDTNVIRNLMVIANQEQMHAIWVLDLLIARDITPDIDNAEEKYWKQTLPYIDSFETGAAVGAHAEAMRLERIKVIADDDEAPEDIRKIFQRILKDELVHEATFRKLAGPDAMALTQGSHDKGRELLGLTA